MMRVHDEQSVQAFGPDSPNKPLRDPIGLGYLNRRANDSRPLGFEHGVQAVGELAIVIADEKTNRVRALGQHPRDLSRVLRHRLLVGMGRAASKVHAAGSRVR